MGRPFCKIFFINVKSPRGSSGKKSGWFCCKKTSEMLKYLNFKCEMSKDIFSSDSIGSTILRMSHVKSFASDKRKF